MYSTTMDIPEIKSTIQGFFGDGLALIVGSGLSCAEGIPGMPALANFLDNAINSDYAGAIADEWAGAAALIEDHGLEAALLQVEISEELEKIITKLTAQCIAEAESKAIKEVFAGGRVLRLSKLLPCLLKPRSGLPIITTNYDRLIEIAGEQVGLGVDNMFVGSFAGTLNEKEAAACLLRNVQKHKQSVRYIFREHIKISKPHGSLGWYLQGDKPLQNMFGTEHDDWSYGDRCNNPKLLDTTRP